MPTAHGHPPATALRYRIELATHRLDDPLFRARWEQLVAAGQSVQQLYQSPAFFRMMADARMPGRRMELLVVVSEQDNEIAGVIPVMIAQQAFRFAIGNFLLYSLDVPVIRLLGSIPAMPAESDLAEHLAHTLLSQFAQAKAIFMQALPIDSAYQHTLAQIAASRSGLATTLLGDWRPCHTMPLPASFEQYLEKFSAKKRYNLNRQLRQLTEQAGTLVLTRVELRCAVDAMLGALAGLLSPEEFAASINPGELAHLATHGLLCCYVLHAGDECLAVILGSVSTKVWHIDKIYVTEQYRALSVGTSAMHLATQDIIGKGSIAKIDFGYGTPKHAFNSSHVLDTRGQVLLYDRNARVRMLFFAHRQFFRATEALICHAKIILKRAAELRKRWFAPRSP